METSRSAIPITDADLDSLKNKAEGQITRINGNQDLEKILKDLSPEETYRTLPAELELVYSIRHATCLYIWFSNWLFEHTGQKQEAIITTIPTESIQKKQKFSSAFSIFVMSNFIVNECTRLLKGKETNLATASPNYKFDVGRNFTTDLQLIFSYYAEVLQTDNDGTPIIHDVNDILAVTRDFWKATSVKALDVVKASDSSIQATVANSTFKYNEFVVHGFTIEQVEEKKSVSFVKVEPEEVVGNTEAIIMLLRLCDRLALYDLETKKNPLCEIGGIYESNLLDGPPGTGKTTLQRMAMTRLAKRAEQMGVPYMFRSLEAKDIKSEWYGRTGKMLSDLLESIRDPNNLALLCIDDIDLLLSNRDDPGAGGADKDLLKGLMDFFSGIGTNYKGNYSSIAATNKPTATDDALRQRFVYRTIVTGAETAEDYADLVALQLKKPLKFGLVTIKSDGYVPLKRTRSRTLMDHKQTYTKSGSWIDVGQFVMELNKKDPQFTARSVKNAMDVVIAKAGDFEIPEEFYSKPDEFKNKPYEIKVEIIKKLYGQISSDSIIGSLTDQFDSEMRYSEAKYVNKK
jgi:hypothetical protein